MAKTHTLVYSLSVYTRNYASDNAGKFSINITEDTYDAVIAKAKSFGIDINDTDKYSVTLSHNYADDFWSVYHGLREIGSDHWNVTDEHDREYTAPVGPNPFENLTRVPKTKKAKAK